ncbi:MAG: PD-(D/E)XK nuclease family transposase, partial [Oscillospiraceae bacterium]|nr:PD-(D/E)XK nuclease family transposase [Oscillospiraceae bacterium]
DVKIQYALRNIGTHSVTLDVLAEDNNSKLYNIEVQKPDNDYHPRRMRYYQSNIDISYFEKGKKYMELPDIYLIYITLFDVFKLGDNYYHIKRIIDGHGVESDNGVHEIYLNTAVKTDKPITRLMEYFKNTDADRADFGPLSDKVRNIKNTNQGVNSMSEAVLEMAERYAQKKLEEQKKENQKQLEEQKKENQRKLAQQRQNTIENMRAKGLSEELIMEIIGEQL